jgi:CubicO group peptidase (beta-lactamase class C family)
VRQLLAHTSGLPDYFEGKRADGPNTFSRLLKSDFAFSYHDVLSISNTQQTPHFQPGEKDKALYSDTNYQLLGAIIERQYQKPFREVVHERIVETLGLKNTFCFSNSHLDFYDHIAPMKYGRETLRIPKGMASVQADGGIVSTLEDSFTFLKAFFGGQHVPREILEEMQSPWRNIFFPLSYVTGLMSFQVPWYFSPFQRFPRVIGHSGASGALMFYCPEWKLFVAGTVNQVKNRSACFQWMIQALALARQ